MLSLCLCAVDLSQEFSSIERKFWASFSLSADGTAVPEYGADIPVRIREIV